MEREERKEFSFYCYNPPTDGKYYVNGFEYFSGEDFRNVKRYKEYMAMGCDILLARYENSYNGEEWETSNAKMVFDRAYEAGIRKIIITDRRIDHLINNVKVLIGTEESCPFKTEKELDETLSEWVSVYKDAPGFYGIQLVDEPSYEKLVRYGQVARSLKRVLPSAVLQCNLFPMSVEVPGVDDHIEAYSKYLNDFLDYTQVDCVSVDPYPFRREYIILGYEITTQQLIAEQCAKRGIEFHCVMQAFSSATDGILRWRPVNERDMYWQMNLALGFGAREYSFYTYFPKPTVDYKKGSGQFNGTSIMNLDGSPTSMYFYVQRIIEEFKKFAPIQLKYKYKDSYIIVAPNKSINDFEWTALAIQNENCPIQVEIDRGCAIVTELENGEDRLYMLQNIDNIKEEYFNGAKAMQAKIRLGEGTKTFYFKGEKINLEQVDGAYQENIKIGDAIFVEIKNN